MKKRLWKPMLLLGLFLLTVIACGISFDGGDEKSSQEDIEFQLTLEALQRTQTAAAAPPDKPKQPPEDSLPDKDSDDDSGDNTACNSSKFVSETIPDGSVYQAGETFTKSWTIRNAGTCDWTTDYKFVFESGDQMNGLTSMNVPSVIEPGEKITFQIDLTAPSADGDYTGIWRLKAADGEKLGKYWVKITVGSGAPPPPPPTAFAVTGVEFYMPHTTIDMGCSNSVNVKAEITTNAAGTVTGYWEDSTDFDQTPISVTFAGAEKKIIDYNVEIFATDDYQVYLYIDQPNHQLFGPKEFHVNCTQ